MKLQIKIIAVAALALVALVFVWRGSAAASTGPECMPGGGFVPRFCVTVPAGPAIRRETTVALASVASRTADLRVEAGIPAGEALRVAGALDRAAAQVERAFGRSFSERPRVLLFATPKSFAQGIEDLFVYPSDVARTAAASYGGIVDQRTLTVAVDFRASAARSTPSPPMRWARWKTASLNRCWCGPSSPSAPASVSRTRTPSWGPGRSPTSWRASTRRPRRRASP